MYNVLYICKYKYTKRFHVVRFINKHVCIFLSQQKLIQLCNCFIYKLFVHNNKKYDITENNLICRSVLKVVTHIIVFIYFSYISIYQNKIKMVLVFYIKINKSKKL